MSSADSLNLDPQESYALSNTPTIQPPPGVEPNFVNPANHGQALIAVASLFLGLTSIFALARAYVKTCIVRKYSWDDLSLFIGFVGTVSFFVTCFWGTQKGKIGIHEWDVSIVDITSQNLLIPLYLISILLAPTMLFTKVSFFIMYLDVFHLIRWLKISAYIGGIVTALFYGAMTVCSFVFGAAPPHHETTHDMAISLELSVPQSCVGLVIDLYILILPILGVTRLQMSIRRKVGVILVFLSAILACTGSLLSIYYRRKLTQTKDITWALLPVLIVTLLELYIGIIVACMPSASCACRHLSPVYENLKASFLSSPFASIGPKLNRSAQALSKNNSTEHTSCKNDGNPNVRNERPYKHLDDYKHHFPGSPNPASAKIMQTFIGGESHSGIENDGIHLTFEMQQSDYRLGTDVESSTWNAAD
ncbi:hypothetical protein JMJ35_000931 [Cladonia borealis]|uniref:Rhodopsin domain-containing protein n=1 Tax=Cladonia borealis TaxID=184061 RepID=A0AA39V4U0_9LECA|nr:hypothetical protein JMJ35_000931 [Cladonia borealis]